MKRFFCVSTLFSLAMATFASGYYDNSYSSGWITFYAILMFVWGILQIILFFKVWGMTDDIRALKRDYFNEKDTNNKESIDNSLKQYYLQGDLEKVKKILIKQFIDKVESDYLKMKTYDYEQNEKGDYVLVSRKEKNLNVSIRSYVERLKKQYELIGEDMPEFINKMETFGDYYNLFEKMDSFDVNDSKTGESHEHRINYNSMPSNSEKKETDDNEYSNTDGTNSDTNKQSSSIVIPLCITAIFFIVLLFFHANYSYTKYWVEEYKILIPAIIIYVIVLVVFFVVRKTKKKH